MPRKVVGCRANDVIRANDSRGQVLTLLGRADWSYSRGTYEYEHDRCEVLADLNRTKVTVNIERIQRKLLGPGSAGGIDPGTIRSERLETVSPTCWKPWPLGREKWRVRARRLEDLSSSRKMGHNIQNAHF